MFAIIEFFVWLFVMPFVFFAMTLGNIGYQVSRAFEPRFFFGGVWCASFGLFLLPNSTPDDAPFVSLVDGFAQSHIVGIPTPVCFLVAGAVLIASAAMVKAKRRE